MVQGRFLQDGKEFAWRVMISRNLIAIGKTYMVKTNLKW
jgi:hypothetical protein